MAIRRALEPPYGWQLYSPFQVVCHRSLDNVAAWLTAAEQREAHPRPARPFDALADG